MWPEAPEDIAAQARQYKASILEVRDDQIATQHQLEEAGQDEIAGRIAFAHATSHGDTAGTVRAAHLIDAALRVQTTARRLVDDQAKAISSLQDELAALTPRQRDPDD